MSDSLASNQVGDSPTIDLIGKVMVVIIIILFMVVVVALAFHLYAKVFWWRRSSHSQSRPRSATVVETGKGLDPSILMSLPISIFQPKDSSKDSLECSVCLSELVEGEKLRLLPKCNHSFHVNCIDMWFQSHTTCPLCRTIVVASQSEDLESQSFPTNVLIWGNQTQITTTTTTTSSSSSTAGSLEESTSNNTTKTTSSHNGMLVIDIPSHGEEEIPSSSSPVIRRLRSLGRLLSNNKLNPWSPSSTEIKGEEGHS